MTKKLASTCLLICASGAVLLTGCMVGPKYQRPETAADTNDGYFHAGGHVTDVLDEDLPQAGEEVVDAVHEDGEKVEREQRLAGDELAGRDAIAEGSGGGRVKERG